eukprot:gene23664-28676_t
MRTALLAAADTSQAIMAVLHRFRPAFLRSSATLTPPIYFRQPAIHRCHLEADPPPADDPSDTHQSEPHSLAQVDPGRAQPLSAAQQAGPHFGEGPSHSQTELPEVAAAIPTPEPPEPSERCVSSYLTFPLLHPCQEQRKALEALLLGIGSRRPLEVEPGEHCSICHEDWEAGEGLRRLPCAHVFHAGCIARWLLQNLTCPACRASVPASAAGAAYTRVAAPRAAAAASAERSASPSLPTSELAPTSSAAPSAAPGRPACIFFQRGTCRRGTLCQFSHTHEAGPICRFHRRQPGSCRFGDRCLYKHGEESGAAGGGGGGGGSTESGAELIREGAAGAHEALTFQRIEFDDPAAGDRSPLWSRLLGSPGSCVLVVGDSDWSFTEALAQARCKRSLQGVILGTRAEKPVSTAAELPQARERRRHLQSDHCCTHNGVDPGRLHELQWEECASGELPELLRMPGNYLPWRHIRHVSWSFPPAPGCWEGPLHPANAAPARRPAHTGLLQLFRSLAATRCGAAPPDLEVVITLSEYEYG